MDASEGENVVFEKVLLIDNDGAISIGEPVITDTVVEATVLGHPRSDKVIIFKKKRRKRITRRDLDIVRILPEVEILFIGPKDAPRKKAAPKPEKKVVEAPAVKETKTETYEFRGLAFHRCHRFQGHSAFRTVSRLFQTNFRVHGAGINYFARVFCHCLTLWFS